MTPQRDDPELRGPARLAPPRVPVVRLNRRVLYVVGAVLFVVVVAGLVALRAQSSRLAQDSNSARASRLPPAGERWFDKVPDREPSGPLATTGTPPTGPAPALLPSTPAPGRTLSDAELEAQRRDRARRAAMAAPIAAVAFEARSVASRASGPERSTTAVETRPATAGSIVPAAALAAAQAAAASLPPAARPAAPQTERPDVLPATLREPVSPYEVKAGTIIPAVLLTGISSDLPGQLIAQVRDNFETLIRCWRDQRTAGPAQAARAERQAA